MAKVVTRKRQKRLDLNNLSQRDLDILKMDTKEVMAKYSLGKQPVYDRRFALKKKIDAAGLTIDDITVGAEEPVTEPKKARRQKEVSKKKTQKKAAIQEVPEPVQDRQVMVVDKQVPAIVRPIEINFENFSLKLNGVPKKICVNPETNAIEIDL